MKFRKRPVVVEAVQFLGTKKSFDEIWAWACPSNDTIKSPVHCGNRPGGEDDYRVLYVDTLEGEMKAFSGDWIIRGVVGEFYPCNSDVFLRTYALVEGEPAEQENKPCPFCGGEEPIRDHNEYGKYWLMCRSCAATGPWMKSEAGGDAAWNRRM